MKKITKLLAAVAFFAGFSATLASCHDHDEVCSDTGADTEQLANTDLTADALRHVLYHTTALDTLPSNWTSSSFSVDPTCGDCVDQATPRVRTIVASSTASAIELFKLMTDQDGETYSKTWSHDSIGTIVLNTDSTETLYATIDVNVRQLNLDQIRFVPESALGNNWTRKKWRPRYHFGDVLKVTKKNGGDNQTPEYWLCIRGEFCDPDISDYKETAHWVCFSLDNSDNVDHRVGNITIDAPKNLHGEHTYLQNLPKLLYLICNPTGAFEKWNGIVTGGNSPYGKYCFFGDPFPYNYFYNTDFNRISNNIINTFYKEGGLEKLVPAFGGRNGLSLMNHIAAGKPLAFVCDGVTYPSGWKNYNPVTFNDVRKYSGNFYTTYKKYDVKYDFKTGKKDLRPFDIREMVKEPFEYAYTYFNNLYEQFGDGTSNDTRVLVVRYKSADKFAGIKNPKNHGEEYRSSQLDFVHFVADTYEAQDETGHKQHAYQVSVSDPFLLGDVVRSSMFTARKKALCIGYMPNEENSITGNELFLCDGEGDLLLTLHDKTVPDEGVAKSILMNVLNAYLVENGVNVEAILKKYSDAYDWKYYVTALKEMRKQGKTLADDNGEECMLDKYFKASKEESADGTVFSVEMNYAYSGMTIKSMKLSFSTKDDNIDKYYTLTKERAAITVGSKYAIYNYGDAPRASFQRVSYVGSVLGERNNLNNLCGHLYSTLSGHINEVKQK